jgi:hypothetical protein
MEMPRVASFTFSVVSSGLFGGMVVCLIVGPMAGCASGDGTRMGNEPANAYLNSNADPSTYGADAFTFNKREHVRPANDFMFYFKNCNLSGERGYYSRTDYWCTYP